MSEQAVYLDDVYAPLEDGLEAPQLTLIEGGGEGVEDVGRIALLELATCNERPSATLDDEDDEESHLSLVWSADADIVVAADDEPAATEAELNTGFTTAWTRRKQPLLTVAQEADMFGRMEVGALAQERLDRAQAGEISLNEQDLKDLRYLAKDGRRAEEYMVRVNQGLVGGLARARLGSGLEYATLFQAGNIGLLRAIRRYEPRGYKFSSYATLDIRKAMSREITEQTMEGLGYREAERLDSIQIAERRLAAELGEQPDAAQIAKELKCDVEEVRRLLERRRERQLLSMELKAGAVPDETEGVSLGERILEDADVVGNTSVLREAQAGVHTALDGLPPQAADIVRRRHGLSADDDLTSDEAQEFKAIAAHWGITRQEAQNLYARTMRQLRKDPRLAALL